MSKSCFEQKNSPYFLILQGLWGLHSYDAFYSHNDITFEINAKTQVDANRASLGLSPTKDFVFDVYPCE